MSRVLGVRGSGEVTPFTPSPLPPALDPASEEIERLSRALDETHARIRLLEQEAAGQEARLGAAETAAFEKGRALGHEEAARLEDERLARLSATLETSAEAFRAALHGLEPLAVDLALACLERITGDPAFQAELVLGTLRHNLADLDRGARVLAEVAAADFPDQGALEALGRLHDVEIILRPDLPQGGCLIRPTLGEIHLDIPDQAERLRRVIVAVRDTTA